MSGLPDWASSALLEAVKDDSWLPLCDELHLNIKNKLSELSVHKRFCELTGNEQAVLVERSYQDMQRAQSKKERSLLEKFSKRMSREVDEELLKHILKDSLVLPLEEGKNYTALPETKKGYHPTNVDKLMDEYSAAIIHMLENSPANIINTTKLFMNRPLPGSIRPYIWSRALWLGDKNVSKMVFSRLAPSLDLILSRRCHSILDKAYPRLSSRNNASFAKTIVSHFMRMVDMKLPTNGFDSFEEMDNVVYLVIPLIVLLRSNYDTEKRKEVDPASNPTSVITANKKDAKGIEGKQGEKEENKNENADREGDEEEEGVQFSDDITELVRSKVYSAINRVPHAVENALFALLEPKKLGLLAVANEKLNFVERSPIINRVISLFSTKDPETYSKIWRLRATENTVKRAEKSEYNVESTTTTFDAFINEQLKRGLSGLLNLDTLLFVWDQGFIADFGGMIPLVLVALIIGDKEELRGLSTFVNAVETFTSYCQGVTVSHLQNLMGKVFPTELMDMFDLTGNYEFKRGDDSIMQASYKRVELESNTTAMQKLRAAGDAVVMFNKLQEQEKQRVLVAHHKVESAKLRKEHAEQLKHLLHNAMQAASNMKTSEDAAKQAEEQEKLHEELVQRQHEEIERLIEEHHRAMKQHLKAAIDTTHTTTKKPHSLPVANQHENFREGVDAMRFLIAHHEKEDKLEMEQKEEYLIKNNEKVSEKKPSEEKVERAALSSKQSTEDEEKETKEKPGSKKKSETTKGPEIVQPLVLDEKLDEDGRILLSIECKEGEEFSGLPDGAEAVGAWYGKMDAKDEDMKKDEDVIENIEDLLVSGEPFLVSCETMKCDPFPGAKKKLTIKYIMPAPAEVDEGDS